MQFPTDEHEIPGSEAPGKLFPELLGAVIAVARAQVADDSVATVACVLPELSTNVPDAVQLPTDEHETALKEAPGSAWALAGAGTSVACAQVPPANAGDAENSNPARAIAPNDAMDNFLQVLAFTPTLAPLPPSSPNQLRGEPDRMLGGRQWRSCNNGCGL